MAAKTPEQELYYQLHSKWMTEDQRAYIEKTYSTVEEQLAAAREWNAQAKANAGCAKTGDSTQFSKEFNWRIDYKKYHHIEPALKRGSVNGFEDGVILPSIEFNPEVDPFQNEKWFAFEKVDGSNHGVVLDPVSKKIYPRGKTSRAVNSFGFTEFFNQFTYEIVEKAISKYIEITDKPITLFLEFFGKGVQEPIGSKYDPIKKHCALIDIRVGDDENHRNYCYYGFQKPEIVEGIFNELIAGGIKDIELPKRLPDLTPQTAIDLVRLGFYSNIFYNKEGENIASNPTKWGPDYKPQSAEGIVIKYFDEDDYCHFAKIKVVDFRNFDRAIENGKITPPSPDKYPPIPVLKEKYKDNNYNIIFIN